MMPIKPNGEIFPPLKCSTCPLSCGCSWECLRGDDLAEIHELRVELERMTSALQRARCVLNNMAWEREGAIFNRWPINHEPLRNDARNLLPVIDAALGKFEQSAQKLRTNT